MREGCESRTQTVPASTPTPSLARPRAAKTIGSLLLPNSQVAQNWRGFWYDWNECVRAIVKESSDPASLARAPRHARPPPFPDRPDNGGLQRRERGVNRRGGRSDVWICTLGGSSWPPQEKVFIWPPFFNTYGTTVECQFKTPGS